MSEVSLHAAHPHALPEVQSPDDPWLEELK
jgi:hypothetical protein